MKKDTKKEGPSWFRKIIRKHKFNALLSVLIIIAGAGIWYIIQMPKTQAEWSSEHQFSPTVRQNGSVVNIFRYRDFKYKQGSIQERMWEEKSFDIKRLQGVEIVLTEGPRLSHNAPAMLIFDFGIDGDIAVSIEPRLERKEIFKDKNALWRQYELIYVFGSEEDLLSLRKLQGAPLYRIPLKVTFEQNRLLLLSIIERAKKLREHSEWYHPWFNSSHSNLMHHLQQSFGKVKFYNPQKYKNKHLLQVLSYWEAININTNSLEQVRKKTKILP